MKRTVSSLITIVIILGMLFFTINVNAQEPDEEGGNQLNNLTLTVDKEIVKPGDTITLTITFGEELSAYIFDVLYDRNLFEFVGVNHGLTTPLTDRVRIIRDIYDGNLSNSNLSVTFKAIEGNNQSVPADFLVTATGLKNIDGTVYNNITTPIDIDFVIEPDYIPYTISLNYADTILPNQEKPMIIGINSPMGRYYDNVRLTVDVTGPEGSTAKLLGIDNNGVEYDLIANGLGGAEGYSVGGAGFTQEFNYRGLFDKEGEYALTFKLIDIGGNQVIAQSSYNLRVGVVTPVVPEQTPQTTETLPAVLPKTGNNTVIIICIFSILTIVGYILYKRIK